MLCRIVPTNSYPDPARNPDILVKLPPAKREAIAAIKQEKARRQSASAWLLLSDMLLEMGTDLSQLCITFGPGGKPEAEGVHFSLSHSADYVLCAISDTPVGADLQLRGGRDTDRLRSLAARFFSEKEILALRGCGDEAAFEKLFYDIFCCKEAFIKCTGEGMKRDLRSFTVPLVQNSCEMVFDGTLYRFEEMNYGHEEEKEIKTALGDGYSCACCSAVHNTDICGSDKAH